MRIARWLFFVNFSCGASAARSRVLVLHLLLGVLFVYFDKSIWSVTERRRVAFFLESTQNRQARIS